MTSLRIGLVACALALAACAAPGAEPEAAEPGDRTTTSTIAPATTGATTTTSGVETSTSTTSATTATTSTTSTTVVERTRPEGEIAPDFELALGEGGVFSLSGEAKPVYMVFWAEW